MSLLQSTYKILMLVGKFGKGQLTDQELAGVNALFVIKDLTVKVTQYLAMHVINKHMCDA